MSKSIKAHLSHITAANLQQFQKEAFSSYASCNVKGVNVQLGVTGEGKFAVIKTEFKQPDCIQRFNTAQEAINKYESYIV